MINSPLVYEIHDLRTGVANNCGDVGCHVTLPLLLPYGGSSVFFNSNIIIHLASYIKKELFVANSFVFAIS